MNEVVGSVTEVRQRHRDRYVKQLRTTFPDPADPIRQQAEPMLDRWWPGTQEKHPERRDQR